MNPTVQISFMNLSRGASTYRTDLRTPMQGLNTHESMHRDGSISHWEVFHRAGRLGVVITQISFPAQNQQCLMLLPMKAATLAQMIRVDVLRVKYVVCRTC